MSRIQEVPKRTKLDETNMRAVDRELASLGDGGIVRPDTVADIAGSVQEETIAPLSAMTDSELLGALLKCPRCDWSPDSEAMLFLGGKSPNGSTEEFRALRFRLCEVRKEREVRSLLIASSVPGEGRSFVAANLAQVMALQADSRVLLIDADLRSSRLHSMLGTFGAPGLSDYLLREAEPLTIIQRGQDDGLFFIPAGCPVPSPTELLANGRLGSLLRRLERMFDWIILDSPAAIPVSDACALAGFCDGVLMVVRSNSTPFDVVRKAQQRFAEQALTGVVLNRIESKRSRQRRRLESLRLW